MLNPSTATAEADDPTIRRCIGFSKAWGFDGLVITNVFAYRATDPGRLLMVNDPTGPQNKFAIRRAMETSDLVVGAWGAWWDQLSPRFRPQRLDVPDIARSAGRQLYCVGLTAGGHPRHPLYVKKAQRPEPMPETHLQGTHHPFRLGSVAHSGANRA